MKIVVDANVVISAAIVDGRTREILHLGDATFLAPPELEQEVRSHSSLITEKSSLREQDVEELLDLLFEAIGTVPYGIPPAAMQKARDAIGDEDSDDVPYLATAIAVDADGIWSDDKVFDSQPYVQRLGSGVRTPSLSRTRRTRKRDERVGSHGDPLSEHMFFVRGRSSSAIGIDNTDRIGCIDPDGLDVQIPVTG